MIRKLLNGDIDRVADIWLKTNLKAHYFISKQYWKSNYELVKGMMPSRGFKRAGSGNSGVCRGGHRFRGRRGGREGRADRCREREDE